jgi:hypothetical protein
MSSSLDLGGEGTFLSHAILIKTFVGTGVSVLDLTQKPGVGDREMERDMSFELQREFLGRWSGLRNLKCTLLGRFSRLLWGSLVYIHGYSWNNNRDFGYKF